MNGPESIRMTPLQAYVSGLIASLLSEERGGPRLYVTALKDNGNYLPILYVRWHGSPDQVRVSVEPID